MSCKPDPAKSADKIEQKEKSQRLIKTRAKIRAVCTETELNDFIYFIRDDTMAQLVAMDDNEIKYLINTYRKTH